MLLLRRLAIIYTRIVHDLNKAAGIWTSYYPVFAARTQHSVEVQNRSFAVICCVVSRAVNGK
jgi:hypothetical protein